MDTKAIITNSMRDLMKVKPFSKITIQDILDHSGLSRSTFYRHFRDKYQVMTDYYERKTISYLECPDAPLRKKVAAIADFVLNNRDYFRGVAKTEGANSFSGFISDYAKRFFVIAYRNKHNLADDEPLPPSVEFMCDYLAGGCSSVIDKWFIVNSPLSRDELIDSICYMIPEDFF